jgi:hypothetical protein
MLKKIIAVVLMSLSLLITTYIPAVYAESIADSYSYSKLPTDSISNMYVKDLTNSGYLNQSSLTVYDKFKAILFALSSSIGNNIIQSEVVANVTHYLDSISATQPQTTELFIQKSDQQSDLINRALNYAMSSSYLSNYDNILLFSIVAEIGSVYAYGSSNQISVPEVYSSVFNTSGNSNSNQSVQASNIYSQMQQNLKLMTQATSTDLKQMYTVSQRAMIYYYAMQSSTPVITTDADTLTLTNNSQYSQDRVFDPLIILNNGTNNGIIYNVRDYVLFMDTMNELGSSRSYMVSQLNNVVKSSDITDNVKQLVTFLQSLKDTITFLTNLPTTDDAKPVLNFWYDKDSTTNKSLETIYEQVSTLGIDTSLVNKYKPSGDQTVHPLNQFFNVSPPQLNNYLDMGIELSATYIPLKTNLYDPYTYKLITDDGFYNFQNQWGYYRKALYMDTDVQSAVNYYTTGKTGKLKVATLADLLNSTGDVTLYTDTKLYNANKLQSLQEKAQSDFDQVKTKIQGAMDTFQDMELIDKEGAVGLAKVLYSGTANTLVDYFNKAKQALGDLFQSPYMSSSDIAHWLAQTTYDPLQSFAFVSSPYVDSDLRAFLIRNGIKPVFVASNTLCTVTNASPQDKSTLFNYILLHNIKSDQLVNYTTDIDMNSPVYMDCYGNIVTESGYVVIPAAANATLQTKYTAVTAAFLTTYGSQYKVPVSVSNNSYDAIGQEMLTQSDVFEDNKSNKYWEFAPSTINSTIAINRLSTGDPNTMNTLYNLFAYHMADGDFDLNRYISNVFMEVMQGAPLEYIDKTGEQLNTVDPSQYNGIIQATKLDNLLKSFNTPGQNSILSLPNLAFMNGIEYIILFVYKACIIGVIIMLFIQIFVSAMKMEFGFRTVMSMVMVIAITLGAVLTIPVLFNISYYQSNKWLLQSETEYIAMLNLEKESAGVQVGLTGTSVPNINTKLYLKVKTINIPWYDLFYKIITSPIGTDMNQLYRSYETSDLAYGQKDFIERDGNIYMDAQTLFDSSDVAFDSDFSSLYQIIHGDDPASFYTPYYAFLTSLIADVNYYNSQNGVANYAAGFYKGGELKSIGLIKDYFSSDQFIQNDKQDILNLRQIYGLTINSTDGSPFTESDIQKMQQSEWCNTTLSESDKQVRIDMINKEARLFVVNNKSMLGKVSDETFLKVMALDLAMYHNKLFGVDSFDSLEIYNLSNNDLTRLAIAPRADVMINSPMSFSKFVLTEGGTPAVYLEAILALVLFISGWVRPLLVLIMFGVLFLSLFIYKLVLRKKSANLNGFFKVVILISLSCAIYAIVIKVSMFLPNMGLPTAVCILADIVIQTGFLAWFCWITIILALNWRDLASARIDSSVLNVKELVTGGTLRARLDNSDEEAGVKNSNYGWRVYNMFKESDEAREYIVASQEDDLDE